MATDYFLKLESISGSNSVVGESADAAHKGEIEITSYSWGIQQTLSIGSQSTGAGAGKAHVLGLDLQAVVSSASPSLLLACARGEVFNATLTIRKAGGKQEEYIKLIMTTAAIANYRQSGGGAGELPRDEISLQYGTIQFEYKPQGKEGSVSSPIKKGWDFIKNKTI